MIPKAEVLAAAEESGVLATTIEKDYALGWILFGVAQHPVLGNWVFKGGTCLKKCYFDTYRFSEDLDFTLPDDLSAGAVSEGLRSVAAWVSQVAGIDVPGDGIEVEQSVNKQGQATHLARLTFRGPRTRDLAEQKFAYKALPSPTPESILAAIAPDVLAQDWANALRHQLCALPPVGEFLAALGDVLRWLFLPSHPVEVLPSVPAKPGEAIVPAVAFAAPRLGLGRVAGVAARAIPKAAYGSRIDRLRYAARNRLLARIHYHGVTRVVEPYSLRMPGTGNLLLYVYEVQRGGSVGGGIKAFKVAELGEVDVTERPFKARYFVEL